MQISCKIIEHSSSDYWQAVKLRSRILRKPLGLTYSADELQSEKDSTHIIALSNKTIVGSLTMKPLSKDVVKMRQVAVDDRLQGQHVGQTMVWFAEQWAAANHHQQIILHVREVAAGFYQKLGYKLETKLFEEIGLPHYRAFKILVKSNKKSLTYL